MPHAEGNGTPDRGLGQAFKSRWSRHGVLPRSSRGHLLTPLFERQEEAQGQELRGQGGSRGGLRRTRADGHEPRRAHPARDRGPDSSCQGTGNRGLELSPGGKTVSESVYARLDVRPVINGMGTYTLLGGSIMPPEVVAAMAEAARHFVTMTELRQKAGARLAGLLGVPAAMVTAGAASAITVATAACITRGDDEALQHLPETGGLNREIILKKSHMSGYEAQMRLAGARLVWVETRADRHPRRRRANAPDCCVDAARRRARTRRRSAARIVPLIAFLAKAQSSRRDRTVHGLWLPLRLRRRTRFHFAEGFRASISLRSSLARFSRFSACFSRSVSALDGSAAGDLAPAPLSSLIALSRTWREGNAPKPTKPVEPMPSLLSRASSAGRAFFTLSDPASLQARDRTERSGSSIIGMIRS